ncbi:BBT_HP_G0145360.mRNA.1.CDS.1 [Saccharomyces cerevisiae]|nr:BBT_HP_G0134630.mRNA.1.CDS.1 [Saccharomyces cerevisiae]CAI5146181.1 BBT_HP_G0145360.mRNA.1.CDS.1 [Saccharomyces cerevisiae]CAI6978380.1 BBT_HP_G0134630.mRNA.1.CDS.1 [Saccharomyces cerevisiae]CAI6989006.1 BBT_HP_G0145360.mRNA.1.CDS.1 [Saccharomyces cerevisiae]
MINLEDYWEDETPGPDREPTNELRNEVEETITLMELLKVSELKDICRSVSFPVSGRKAVLQDLIRNFLQNALVVGKSDPYRVQAVKFLIERIRKNEPLPVYKDLWNALRKGTPLSAITVRSMEGPPTVQQQSPSVIRQSPTQRRKTSTTSSTSRAPPPTKPDASSSSSSFAVPTIHFKESPFYKIQRLIPELVMNVEVTGGRGMCSAKFKLSKADYNLLSNPNSKHRLYLFSGMINPLGSRGNEPIQFPFPNELRCNNVQIKDNIRGFKSKPGTAKPADLTPHLKPYTQQNNVELIYAFTTKEYKLFGYIVEMITPEQLLEKVLQHPKIIKQATLLYLKKTLREDEEMGLTTTSTIMSLQCPISYTRMKYPSKSINCKHLQCFDALWFLHSQLQIPTIVASETTTPVTNRVIPEYLGNSSSYIGKQLPNILGKTPLNVTAVDNSSHLISPDVSVSSPTPRNTASNASSSALSTPPLIRMSSLDPRGSTVPDKTIRPPINSNSYTASISDSFVQPQESSVFPPREQNMDMSFPSTVNSRFNDPRLNTTRFPDSTLRGATILSNNGLDQRNNSLPTTEAITRNDVGRQNSTPVLPTLPQNLPIRTNSNKSGLPLINNENSVPNPPNTATIPLQKSRLIVNPFIPRRPYSNVLPQKRQLSNTSSTSPIMGTWKTQDYGKKYNSG